MIPIILHVLLPDETEHYIREFVAEHRIRPEYITRLEPETKEFSIKQVRELIKQTIYANSEPRLFILYAFDTASLEAQNALLKTLEEHSPNVQYIMVVTQPYKLLPTIISRSRLIRRNSAEKKEKSTSDIERALSQPLPPLNHPVFQVQKYENPLEPFDLLISHVRSTLHTRPESSEILKEILANRNRVQENNITPQYALDRVIIFIYKKNRHT